MWHVCPPGTWVATSGEQVSTHVGDTLSSVVVEVESAEASPSLFLATTWALTEAPSVRPVTVSLVRPVIVTVFPPTVTVIDVMAG